MVVQPTCLGGFSVVDVKLKVWSLIVQWIRRFVSSPSSWVFFMAYWFNLHFGASCLNVLSRHFSFNPRALPPFYRSLLLAWRAADDGFSSRRPSLVMALSSPHVFTLAARMTANSLSLPAI